MSDVAPRLRFAPSPTGMFHVGGARTALYNWLFVKRMGGTFILRIENTDAERDRPEWIEGIVDAMSWLGLDWDEGPLFQSENIASHAEKGQRLYIEGHAYYCECTRDQVEARAKEGAPPGYDGFCRDRGLGPGEGRALRFRVPEGKTVVKDLIRGEPTFDNANIEDFVVVRSSGLPLYVLASAVDDLDQKITHVVRGEEHLSNAPKQQMLWAALTDLPVPTYAHLPVIVNEKRQKLSKRRDKVALEMYRDEGFLPEAMRNYLALLGWAPRGDREIVPVQEMIDEFRFEDVNKSGAFFDLVKLTHVNGEYIRALSTDDFIARCQPFLDRVSGELWAANEFDPAVFAAVAQMTQERVARLDEVAPMIAFLFVDAPAFDEAAMTKIMNDTARPILIAAQECYATCDWNHETLHQTTLEIGEAHGLKLGKAQAPIRLAVTGNRVGLPLFESLEVLGRERALQRIARLLEVAAG